MKKRSIIRLIFSLLICQLAGGIGSIFTSSAIPTWYSTLIKPSFNPPNWLFGPVWITLYFLMGISIFLVWEKHPKTKVPFIFFGIQLALNSLWSIIFFGLKLPLLAFIEIIILLTFILLTTLSFRKISKTASYLLIPYIVWVTFAAILNFALYFLNH